MPRSSRRTASIRTTIELSDAAAARPGRARPRIVRHRRRVIPPAPGGRCLSVPIPHPRDSGTKRPKAWQRKDLRCPSEAGQRLAECPAREASAVGAQAVVRSSESAVGFVRPKWAAGFVRPKRPGKGEPVRPMPDLPEKRPLAALPLASLPAPAAINTTFLRFRGAFRARVLALSFAAR